MPRIRHFKHYGNDRWEVNWGTQNGVRRRELFESEKDAADAISKRERTLKKYGELWARMDDEERIAIVSVVTEVKQANLTLRQVWDEYKKDHGEKPVSKSVPYKDAVAELKRRKLAAGKDERYVEELAALLLRFGKGQEQRHIDQITVLELQTWINAQKWGLSAKRSNYGRFSSLWKMAVDLGWAPFNIVDRLEPIGKIPVKVAIWPNETCTRLLATTLQNDQHKRVIAPIVLGLFGCMRPEEVSHPKWGWQHIDLQHGKVTVPAEVAKTGDQRTFNLQPVALEWLKLAKETGCLLPCPNERRLIDACCEFAGIEDWPHDILRKCCATHLSNHYKNDWMVIRDMGNSVRILLKHYKDLLTPEELSKEYWAITPARAREELKCMIKDFESPSEPSASETATPSH